MAIISSFFFSVSSSLLSFWNSNFMDAKLLDIITQVTEAMLYS